jgi:hypothetical protein
MPGKGEKKYVFSYEKGCWINRDTKTKKKAFINSKPTSDDKFLKSYLRVVKRELSQLDIIKYYHQDMSVNELKKRVKKIRAKAISAGFKLKDLPLKPSATSRKLRSVSTIDFEAISKSKYGDGLVRLSVKEKAEVIENEMRKIAINKRKGSGSRIRKAKGADSVATKGEKSGRVDVQETLVTMPMSPEDMADIITDSAD